jgi:hypothetical protein
MTIDSKIVKTFIHCLIIYIHKTEKTKLLSVAERILALTFKTFFKSMCMSVVHDAIA